MNTLLLFCLATSSLAIPTKRVEKAVPYNALLPNVTIYATGGTIAGSSSSNTDTTGYTAGAIGVQVLIDAVPEITNVSNVAGIQVANVGSGQLTPSIILDLSQKIQKSLDAGDSGAVVTHGTDTIEETSFFLDLTVNTTKPIVCVGAMRPATAISADGPMNLLQAVTLATTPKAAARGAMIILNDRIGSAFYTTKTHSNALDTFRGGDAGYLGLFLGTKPKFFFEASKATGKPFFDVSKTKELPKVDIVYAYQGLDPKAIVDSAKNGAKGIVIAAMGAGSFTREGNAAVEEAVTEYGVQVVYSSRTGGGYVPSAGYAGGVAGGFYNPQKARYLLMLAINAGYTHEQLVEVFAQ
jgi:L-asparaginase